MKNSSLISIALIIGLSYQPVLPAQEESTAKKLVDYTKGTVNSSDPHCQDTECIKKFKT